MRRAFLFRCEGVRLPPHGPFPSSRDTYFAPRGPPFRVGSGPARPLRTAERARASSNSARRNIPSYKEPTVDALAPDADEGRGWLRKATGSCLPSFDPWISEWGNPAGVMPSHPGLNT
jgi:hypothetical protein